MSLIQTPFGFRSTAAEVAAGVELTGRRVIVTGASSGIGIETVRALANTGAEVTLAVRDLTAGDRVAKDVAATSGNPELHVAPLDLADPASIAAFVASWDGPLHVLVNNAGVMACPEERTGAGWELQFATNHLGHFALTIGLHRALAADGAARIVSVSSSGHQLSPVIFDDLHFVFRPYDPWLAYGQSKTEQGAATSVLLAVSPLLQGIGGRYFVDCNEAETVDRRTGNLGGVARYALDPANAERLWTISEQLLHRQPTSP